MHPLEEIARRVAIAVDADLAANRPRGAYARVGMSLGATKNNADNRITGHLRQRDKPGEGSLLLNVMDLLALGSEFDKKPGQLLDEVVDGVKSDMGLPVDAPSTPEPVRPAVRAPLTLPSSVVRDLTIAEIESTQVPEGYHLRLVIEPNP